jgi:hypothetical protein
MNAQAPWEQPHHDAGPAASRTLALLVLRQCRSLRRRYSELHAIARVRFSAFSMRLFCRLVGDQTAAISMEVGSGLA